MESKKVFSVKVHKLYREIVAICDKELLGKNFEEGNRQLQLTEVFFGGQLMEETEVLKLLKAKAENDATFNLVGEKAVKAGLKAGILKENGVAKIQGVPYALA